MVLIDTSVWVDFFRKQRPEAAVVISEAIEEDAATCGIVLQEVLQGIYPARYVEVVRKSLLRNHYLEASQEVYQAAAGYIRRCRAKGLALSTVDGLIVAIAVRHRAALWTLDKDFVRAARWLPIRLYRPGI